jgi:hypothetical protein
MAATIDDLFDRDNVRTLLRDVHSARTVAPQG